MSSVTNFLKLFKWDTKTDGTQKFNIDKALNENWDKVDTYLENLEIGGRNLLLDSKKEITSSTYNIADYALAEEPTDEEEYTISIKATIGQGKTQIGIFNSNSRVDLKYLEYDENKKIYTGTFKWKSKKGSYTADNSVLKIYMIPSSVTVESSIEWVKLEKGNKATDWTPAPEDKANLIDLDTKMNLYRDTKALTKKGWYRVAEFVRTGIYIVNITQRWNETRPSSCLLLVNVGAQNFNISIIDAQFVNSNTIGISQVRLVKDIDTSSASAFLEIYYNYNVSNNVTVQIINESIDTNSINKIHFIEKTSEDVFVKATKTMKILHLDDTIGTLSDLKTSTKVSLVTAINRLVGEELWTNPDITTNFESQTITLNNGISNYNYYEILYATENSNTATQKRIISTGRIPKNKFTYMQFCSNYMFYRVITGLTGTSITFDNCKYYADYGGTGITIDNSKIIPYKVIGYKD